MSQKKKEPIKVSLSTFLFIIALFVIIFMCFIIWKLYENQKEAVLKTEELENQTSTLNKTIEDLQNEINTTNSVTSNDTTNNNASNQNDKTSSTSSSTNFTDEQVKTCLQNYIDLHNRGVAFTFNGVLQGLSDKGLIKYDDSNWKVINQDLQESNIKYADYKNAMLNFVSEKEFNKNWQFSKYKKTDGYCNVAYGLGGESQTSKIIEIKKTTNNTYTGKIQTWSGVYEKPEEDENMTYENCTFTITNYNGKCVIDSISGIKNESME